MGKESPFLLEKSILPPAGGTLKCWWYWNILKAGLGEGSREKIHLGRGGQEEGLAHGGEEARWAQE